MTPIAPTACRSLRGPGRSFVNRSCLVLQQLQPDPIAGKLIRATSVAITAARGPAYREDVQFFVPLPLEARLVGQLTDPVFDDVEEVLLGKRIERQPQSETI